MIISDLNHLETISSETQVVGGGIYEFDYVRGSVLFGSLTAGAAYGHVAVGDASANAYGSGTFTKAQSATYTTPWYSGSAAGSISVSN